MVSVDLHLKINKNNNKITNLSKYSLCIWNTSNIVLYNNEKVNVIFVKSFPKIAISFCLAT